MRKQKTKILSVIVSAVFALSCFAGVSPAGVSASESEAFGATAACSGNMLESFNGVDACVNTYGELHVCKNNFPDANFRDYLLGYANGDGYISQDKAADISNISVYGFSISSLKGIEYFTGLESLSCYNNPLTELDVSNNTELMYLYCNNNQLTELDVSNNTALDILGCTNNRLTELDLSNNTELTELYCYNNQLTELDLSNNTALKVLGCNGNQLTELDVSNNTELTDLDCYNNQLTELDLSSNDKLTNMDIGAQTVSAFISQQEGSIVFDLGKLVAPENLGRITSVKDGNFDKDSGLVYFDSEPESFIYYYDTGRDGNTMSVIVTVKNIFATSPSEAVFDSLWVGDTVTFLAFEFNSGDEDSTGYSIKIQSGSGVELTEVDAVPGGIFPGLKFTAPGQSSVLVTAVDPGTGNTLTCTYNFTVTERPADRPVTAEQTLPSKLSYILGDYSDNIDEYSVHYSNLNYGARLPIYFSQVDDLFFCQGGAGGGGGDFIADDRSFDQKYLLTGGNVAYRPGSTEFQPYCQDGPVGEPTVITVQEPVITDNAPSDIHAGSTVRLETALTNTSLKNIKVADFTADINEYGFYCGSEKPLAFRPSVTVIEGQDCVLQSEQDYTNTLTSAETLTFTKPGVVKLSVKYENILIPNGNQSFPAYNPEKIITIYVTGDSAEMFTDMESGRWYKEYVDYAATFKLMNGMTPTTFEPTTTLNRAMFAQILANMSGVDTSDSSVGTVFTDVPAGKWYTPAVKWAYDNGIVDGMTPTTFEPLEPIQRQQICVMVVRYAEKFGIELTADIEKKAFEDDSNIQNYAKEAVYICQQAGIVDGKTETEFLPKDNATRAEIATIIMRFHKNFIAG